MRAGGSKQKGSKFERETCVKLSTWVTNGERDDIFWRSSQSGGRATRRMKVGKKTDAATGDISAIAPEGHDFLSVFMVECKHVRDLSIVGTLLHGKGNLAKFWRVLRTQSKHHHLRPLLIAKQNNLPVIALLLPEDAPLYFSVAPSREVFRAFVLEHKGVSAYLLKDLLNAEYDSERFVP